MIGKKVIKLCSNPTHAVHEEVVINTIEELVMSSKG